MKKQLRKGSLAIGGKKGEQSESLRRGDGMHSTRYSSTLFVYLQAPPVYNNLQNNYYEGVEIMREADLFLL